MSKENKNRIEVQDALIATIEEGLALLQYTGWMVMEYAPSQFASFDKVISLQLLRSRNAGWQGHENRMVDGKPVTVEKWIDQQSWQVQIILKRKRRIDGSSILAEDIANNLAAWLNSAHGVVAMKKRGLAPLIVDDKLIFVYNDNSEIYQKRAVFTVKVQVPKELIMAEEGLDAIKPDIKPV